MVPGLLTGYDSGDPQVSQQVDGPDLSIEVRTYGNSCRAKGELRLSKNASTKIITVAPFDWLTSGVSCDLILLHFDHSTSVELGNPEDWTVSLSGISSTGEPVEFQIPIKGNH
jgi:hypothetical protein